MIKEDVDLGDCIEEAADTIRHDIQRMPHIGIILGSGLGSFAEKLENTKKYRMADFKGFPKPTVEGHTGMLIFGTYHGVLLAVLSGRFHYYEGYSQNVITIPVRLLADLGYWYAPDGRTREQQALFEQVEVKPQAIEWLFATAFGRKFRVSLDNLTGESGNGNTFKDNVYAQVCRYMNAEACLPKDAWYLISCICTCIRGGEMLQASEFKREMLD